ncbi:hypothetical protein R0K17_11705 [Planococcus sp. SIMBA_143]
MYWLGQAFIIWFERQVGERLKITVEVGPIPYAERYRLLTELEKHSVSFQQSGKQEGKSTPEFTPLGQMSATGHPSRKCSRACSCYMMHRS